MKGNRLARSSQTTPFLVIRVKESQNSSKFSIFVELPTFKNKLLKKVNNVVNRSKLPAN